MRAKKSQNKPLLYTLLIILILAIGVALFIYLLKPEMDYRDSLDEKYSFQTEHLEAMEEELTKAEELATKYDSLTKQEEQIPFTDEADNDMQSVLQDISDAASDSSTVVTDLLINNYDETVDFSKLSKKTGAITEKELLEPTTSNAPISPIDLLDKPKNLQLITLELTVSGYEANDINSFIRSMQDLQRIYVVDEVDYTNPNVDDGVITATIQVTTFASKAVKEEAK